MDEMRIAQIEQELAEIKARNVRVENDKAWERSRTRIAALTIATYVVAAFVLYLIGNPQFLCNAMIPSLGYYLSMRSLPLLRGWWLGRYGRYTVRKKS